MRILQDFEYRRPRTREEALDILAQFGQKAWPLAGGTDLVLSMKHRSMLQLVKGVGTKEAAFPSAITARPIHKPEMVVSLSQIEELFGLEVKDGTVRIGPCMTMWDLADSQELPPALMAVSDAARAVGSPPIRALATIGGNIANGRPAADTAVATLALGARLELMSASGTRKVEANKFYTGPGKTIRKPDELLTVIELDWTERQGSAYFRHGTRRQLEIAMVSVGASLSLDGAGGVSNACISLGAVGPTPVLANRAAKSLIGSKPGSDLFKAAGAAAQKEAKPIDDFRGSANYRVDLVEVYVRRALEKAAERAQG